MRHCFEQPDLPLRAFMRAPGKNRPATLEGGKGGSAPAAPDPWTSAAATTQTNEQTAAFNKALNLNNYSNPFGSQSTTVTGYDPGTGAPIYGTTTSANPQLQGALGNMLSEVSGNSGLNQNAVAGLENIRQSYLPIAAGLNTLQGGINQQTAAQAQQQGQQAAYAAQTQYLDPQFSQQGEALSAQLANQGLSPGSQAYNNAMTNFNNQKQQAYSNAANQAVMTGSQIGSQNLQNQLAATQTQAGLFGQMSGILGDMSNNYGQQVGVGQTGSSELGSLANMVPGYSGTAPSSAQPADMASLFNNQYQGQLAGYNAGVSSSNADTAALGGVASAAIMAAMMY
jgi:hypothetical protein